MKLTNALIFVVLAGAILWGGLELNRRFDQKAVENKNQIDTEASMDETQKVAGLHIEDLTIGTGKEAQEGNKITVHYRGTLESGAEFDSSYSRSTPFSFVLGAGSVIVGWDKGFAGMKEGGKRRLTIAPELAYGAGGVPGAIPPNATLVFEVELLKVE